MLHDGCTGVVTTLWMEDRGMIKCTGTSVRHPQAHRFPRQTNPFLGWSATANIHAGLWIEPFNESQYIFLYLYFPNWTWTTIECESYSLVVISPLVIVWGAFGTKHLGKNTSDFIINDGVVRYSKPVHTSARKRGGKEDVADEWCNVAGFHMFALERNGWNEWLTSGVSFVWVVGAVGLAVAEPGLGDAGFPVATVKLPNVTQDGLWAAWGKSGGGGGDREDAAWGWWRWTGRMHVSPGKHWTWAWV